MPQQKTGQRLHYTAGLRIIQGIFPVTTTEYMKTHFPALEVYNRSRPYGEKDAKWYTPWEYNEDEYNKWKDDTRDFFLNKVVLYVAGSVALAPVAAAFVSTEVGASLVAMLVRQGVSEAVSVTVVKALAASAVKYPATILVEGTTGHSEFINSLKNAEEREAAKHLVSGFSTTAVSGVGIDLALLVLS